MKLKHLLKLSMTALAASILLGSAGFLSANHCEHSNYTQIERVNINRRVEDVSPSTIKTQAEGFADHFINFIVCDDGVTPPDVAIWDWLAGSGIGGWGSMYQETRDLIESTIGLENGELIYQAVTKYDYIINKYNKNGIIYTEFMTGRPVSPHINNGLLSGLVNDNSQSNIIVPIVVVTLLSLSLLILILKFKRNKIE